ncbi:YybH family protein [Winogradskyella sp. A2]|uniref:YybH family protein n=1 Tax=Winogradskyella sp. A2 TaxID=3366944 RepID=UPI00398C36C1
MKQLAIILMAIIFLSSCQNKSENLIKNAETMEKLAKQEIVNLLMTYKGTLNNSNAKKATSLYTKDGVFMPTGAPSGIGTEGILKSYKFVFSQIQLNIEFFIEEIQVEGNMAFAVTSSKGTVKILVNGAEAPEANRELFVFEKVDGEWKIARYMFNKTK